MLILLSEQDRADAVSKMLHQAALDEVTGCLNWIGRGVDPTTGYVNTSIEGKTVRVHRFIALSLLLATDFERVLIESLGLEACHRCDNRRCINYKHLFWGTKAMNAWDRRNKRQGRIVIPVLPAVPRSTIPKETRNQRIARLRQESAHLLRLD